MDILRKRHRFGLSTLVHVAFAQCVLAVMAAELFAARGENIAVVADSSASSTSGDTSVGSLNDGRAGRNSRDRRFGAYGNWPNRGKQWVQYQWSQPISTDQIEVYWWDDRQGVRWPASCRLLYWNGGDFTPVENAEGYGVERDKFNVTTFDKVTTDRLRLEIDSRDEYSTGILEWRVLDSGQSPAFPARVDAGVDRTVVVGGKTYLSGDVLALGGDEGATVTWSKESGPGEVEFADASDVETTATFSAAGRYRLKLTVRNDGLVSSSTLAVAVKDPAEDEPLHFVATRPYKVTSPLWRGRLKAAIVNWIPHCIEKIEDPNLREGGLNNFIEAAKKLRGEDHEDHRGYWFANAWVYNTLESMALALMIDPDGDEETAAAQEEMRKAFDEWIPIILAAQEEDGYLHTQYTIRDYPRWSPRLRDAHEGYVAGYFLECAIAHHMLTGGEDDRLYDAAKRLADCWADNIGPPPKQAWYDGHQGMEQALARLGRYVNDVEGNNEGDHYLALAKILLDNRRDGGQYDQSHLPVVQQYEAVGHAVRAVYTYSGMADVVLATGDLEYQSAVESLWDNIVNRKYYVTGGVGSGETSEGFGPDYSLRNNAYCESCSGCGELFFQHKMNLIHKDARYADLFEETLYNAILGDLDLEGKNFYYQNPLDSSRVRYDWHNCPCCVGNIPRTLLMLPTWMYATRGDEVYVNLYIGSDVSIDDVAGTTVHLVQQTDYPWDGNVSITVNPSKAANFAVNLRWPTRDVSELYSSSPNADGIESLSVNGESIDATPTDGYVEIRRDWKPGDVIELRLPLKVQRVHAVDQIEATRGRVALRYGPLMYNIEGIDQDVAKALSAEAPLEPDWRPELLEGVVAITGKFADGTDLLAIPNYARQNRRSERPETEEQADDGGNRRRNRGGEVRSIVWIREVE